MSRTIAILSDVEVLQILPVDDEPGFGSLATSRGHLPLKAMDVRTRIDGLVARTALAQTFVNTLGEALEATYIFPLPDRAAVLSFQLRVNGRIVEGLLRERGQARREYDQAITQGHRAAIAEEERPGVFTLRVGNLMPGEEATVNLTLVGPLTYDDGEATYRFPLVVAPRYIPGTPLRGPSVGDGTAVDTDAVPDASRISPPVLLPGQPSPVRLSLSVDLHGSGLPVDDVRCSLHAVSTEEGEGFERIAVHPGERLNRDFILRFRLGAQAVRTSLVLQPDADKRAREGTFLLTVVPPAGAAKGQKPRDVVFVLDRSGSMGGWKMVAARRALARMVDSLTDRDRFSVYAFDDVVEAPTEFRGTELVPATDRNRFRAVEFLAQLEARNGTEMAEPLDRAVRTLTAGAANRDRVLVLVTDGQVGNEDQILQLLGPRLQGIRVFTLGIDQAVNEAFLKRLALLGGGAAEIVESEDRLDAVLQKVHRRIGTAICTGLQLKPSGMRIEADTVVPGRLPDLFVGAPLLILGRYKGAPEGTLALEGRDALGRAWSETVPARVAENEAASSLWARGHIRDLEDRLIIGNGDRTDLEKRILDASLKFNVLCRFTAFVAVDRAAVVNPGGEVHKVTQAVEMPAGWEQVDSLASSVLACSAPLCDSEVESVDFEMERCEAKEADSLFEMDLDNAAPAERQQAAPESLDRCADKKDVFQDEAVEKVAEAMENKGHPMGARAAKKFMLAKQVLREMNADGRVSKKTQLAIDDAARDAMEMSGAAAPVDKQAKARKSAPPPAKPAAQQYASRGQGPLAGGGGNGSTPPASRPPAPAPGKASAASSLSRAANVAQRAHSSGSDGKGSIDLTAYRQRGKDLMEELCRGASEPWPTRILRLGVLAEKLAALVEDMRSVGIPSTEVHTLEKLLADLRSLLGEPTPSDSEAERVWTEAEAALRAFTELTAEVAAAVDRREAFWK